MSGLQFCLRNEKIPDGHTIPLLPWPCGVPTQAGRNLSATSSQTGTAMGIMGMHCALNWDWAHANFQNVHRKLYTHVWYVIILYYTIVKDILLRILLRLWFHLVIFFGKIEATKQLGVQTAGGWNDQQLLRPLCLQRSAGSLVTHIYGESHTSTRHIHGDAYVSMYLCIYVSMYLCIYVSMYLCIYVSMYLCIYVSMYLCIYVSIYLSMYVSMYLCIYLSTYLSIYLSILSIYLSIYLTYSISLSIYACICTHTYIYTHPYICIYIYICVCMYMYIYTHRCTYVRIYVYTHANAHTHTYIYTYICTAMCVYVWTLCERYGSGCFSEGSSSFPISKVCIQCGLALELLSALRGQCRAMAADFTVFGVHKGPRK